MSFVRMQLNLRPGEARELKRLAKHLGLNKTETVRRAIADYAARISEQRKTEEKTNGQIQSE